MKMLDRIRVFFMYVVITILMLCGYFGTAYAGSNAVMSSSWEEIPNSDLQRNIAYDWTPNPVPGRLRGMFPYSGAAYDTLRNRMLVTGGGHSDYGGQEIYAFDFDDLSWSMPVPPDTYDAIVGDVNCELGYVTKNGFPKATHIYEKSFYNAVTDEYWVVMGGSSAYSEGKYCADGYHHLAKWSFVNNAWTIHDNPGTGGSVETAGDFDIVTGYWWFVGGGGNPTARVGYYDPATDGWVTGAYDNIIASAGPRVTVVDSSRRQVVMFNQGRIYAMPISSFVEGSTKIINFKVTYSGDAPPSPNSQAWGGMGIAYDPVSTNIIAWDGRNDNVYSLDPGSWTWTKLSVDGGTPGVLQGNDEISGIYGRFAYVPVLDKFALVKGVDDNVFLLNVRRENKEKITSFRLKSSVTDPETPFTTAVGFKKGDVTEVPTLDLEHYQVDVKKYWNDGSVKHAVFSGTYDSTSGAPATVQVFNGGTAPAGTDLTEADIVAAAPSATVQLGSIGAINLTGLLGSPRRVCLQGPEIIEAHYHADVTADPTLSVWFHVRLYRGGEIRVRAVVDNSSVNIDDESGVTKSYIPVVTIGGAIVYNNGGMVLDHCHHTRWTATGWINIPDPQITVAHDTAYLKASGLVPNYWKNGPSDQTLDSLYQTYRPMDNGQWTDRMGNAGYQRQIGLLPLWDALYVNSGGDERAYRAVEAHSEALNSYPIIWPDPNTDAPIVLSSWPNYTVNGNYAGGKTDFGVGGLFWDIAHHGSGGYLAYLITGDYFHLETMEHQAATIFLFIQSALGSGTHRLLKPVQTRGVAWSNRSIGQLVAIAPPGPVVDDFREFLSNGIDHWYAASRQDGFNQLGYVYSYELGSGAYGTGNIATWQQHFWTMTYGMLSDLEPLPDMSGLNGIRDYMYQSVVGQLGPVGVGCFCYTRGGDDTVKISSSRSIDDVFADWGDVYSASYGIENTSCGSVLEDEGVASGPAIATTGYWGNLLPAIAYAVEDGAPGAADAWKRLTGADNWSEIENAGFENTPIWGIVPRERPEFWEHLSEYVSPDCILKYRQEDVVAYAVSNPGLVHIAYMAYLGRPADPEGLDYWAGQLAEAGGDFAAIMDEFLASSEFIDLYGSLSDEELVEVIYQHLFNREPDAAGLRYFVDRLRSGESDLSWLALDIIAGARNSDIAVGLNKLVAAWAFTETVRSGYPYPSGEDAGDYLAGICRSS